MRHRSKPATPNAARQNPKSSEKIQLPRLKQPLTPMPQLQDRCRALQRENRVHSADVIRRACKRRAAVAVLRQALQARRRRQEMMLDAIKMAASALPTSSRTSSSSSSPSTTALFTFFAAACVICRSWLTHRRRARAGRPSPAPPQPSCVNPRIITFSLQRSAS
jgi:hypothetical protein